MVSDERRRQKGGRERCSGEESSRRVGGRAEVEVMARGGSAEEVWGPWLECRGRRNGMGRCRSSYLPLPPSAGPNAGEVFFVRRVIPQGGKETSWRRRSCGRGGPMRSLSFPFWKERQRHTQPATTWGSRKIDGVSVSDVILVILFSHLGAPAPGKAILPHRPM